MRRTLSLLIVMSLARLWATAQVNVNTISTIAGGGAQPSVAINAYLPRPTSAVRDSAGNTYIAVPALNTVFVVSASGALTVYAGTGIAGFSGDGGAANQAQLNFPTGLAIDKGNNLFISDQNNERIRRVDASSKNITTVAGSEDPFFGAYGGDGGSATNARLNSPNSVAVDGNGNLFIADTGNAVVRRVDATTQVITTYVGTNPPPVGVAAGCNTGAATNAILKNPTGVAVDGSGSLFVSDTSLDVVCKVDTSQNVSTYAGTLNTPGTPGAANGDGGPAISAQMASPTGLATDATGNLYITDSGNPAIRKVDTSATHIISTVAGLGTICGNEPGCGDGGPPTRASLNFPEGVFIDANNNIVIADTFNMRVRVVTGTTIANLAGGGSGGDGGAATSAVLGLAQTLVVDANENVFALETAGERLREIDTKGNINTVVGAGFGGATINCPQPGCNGDGGPATAARFVSPIGVATDAQGNFFIVDSRAAVVRAINTQAAAITIAGVTIQPGQIATVAGNGTPCKVGSASYPTCGDAGAAISAGLDIPIGVAVDAGGNIYVSDQGLNTVRVVSQATGFINTFAGTPGQACTTYLTTPGSCDGGGSPTKALLNAPTGLAVSPGLQGGVPQPGATDVFVVDSGDNVVRRISIVSGAALIETISTAAFNGIATFGGDGQSATSASMNGPTYVAVDNLENLYVGGGADNVVRRIDAFSRRVSTVAGDINNLNGGFSGDGGPSTQAMIENTGLVVFNTQQGTHDLFIADSGSNRIRKVNLAPVSSIFPASGSTLTFPVTLDGQSSSQFIFIQNSGPDDLIISNIKITGDATNSYSAAPSCFGTGAIDPPNESCEMSIAFVPPVGVTGTINATLTFTTSDPANPNFTYNLTGTATNTTFTLIVGLTPTQNSSTPGGTVVDSTFKIDCLSNSTTSTCSGAFPAGSTATLTEFPDTNFTFMAWGGACAGTVGSTCTVAMNQAQNVTATFMSSTPPPPTMTINIVGLGSGSGTVSDGATLKCTITNGVTSGTCSAQYPGTGQTNVMLAATPTAGTGSSFVAWLGGFCSPYANPCSISPRPATLVIGSVFTGPAQTFAKGQVFLSTDLGMVFVLDPATGNVVQVLSSNPTTGQGKGLTFDEAGNLYMANPQASPNHLVEKFAVTGTVPPTLFGTGYTGPWSPLLQASGNLLVGQTGHGVDTSVLPTVVQLPQSAIATTPPSATFFPASLNPFTSAYWVELLDSGDIIAYTTGTQTVQVYDLAELAQHPDMITNLHGAFALRELPDSTILVADTDRIVRIDQNGNIKQTYTIPSTAAIFNNLNLDPDGQSFWTNDEFTGVLYRINIQTGAVMNGNGYSTGLGFSASGLSPQIGGIAVFGQALSGGADLAVTMSAPAAVNVGANVTYSLSVSNAGPLNATGVTLTALIPNSTVVSLSPANCTSTTSAQGTNISCPIGNLAANSPAVAATFTMLPSSPGTITATANVAGNESDPNLANNTATATTSTGPACILMVAPNPVVAGFATNATATCSDAAGTIATTTLNFGDGTPVVNGTTAPHTYAASGTFTVTVTATDNLQLTGTASQAVTVSVNQPPSCTLTVAPTSGLAPLSVNVTGACTDPENALSSTLLDFGDGATQASPSGTHTYTNAGTFTVKLRGTDNIGQTGSATQTVTVVINTAPTCTLTVTPTTGIIPLPITATGNCVDAENNIKSIVLDFGDGTIVNAASGTHTYNAAGTFTVKVTATDALGLSGSASQTVTATVNNFPPGLFVGIIPGTVKRFAPDGTLLQTLTTGLNGTVSGMGFDRAGNLYATDFTAGNVSKFDPKTGTLIGTFGSGFNCQPETIVFDGAGNAYVGQQGCSHQILKFDPSGKPVTTFTVATEEQGSDDIDLSADNCTLLYTSEGLSILRYDVCRNQQMTPFATGLKKALMLRILPDGGVIVGDLTDIIRFNASGQQVMTYTAPGEQCLYSITLDQDGTSFWAGDYCSSNIYRFDLNSGKQLAKFNSGTPSGTVFGLAISGSGLNVAGLGNAGNISTSPSSASLASGQSATFTVSFTPNAASAGHTLTLSCASLPAGLSCSFNPPTITLGAAGTTTTATLTISRTTIGALLHPSSPWMLATWMGIVPAIVLVGFRSPRRRRRGSMMWLAAVVACTGIWASCGGGGISKSATPSPTPQGTYTIIVVGNSGGMQASTTVNLTVQ